jgi:hypothetical protein
VEAHPVAVEAYPELWRLILEPWRVCKLDSHEEGWIWIWIKVKSRIQIPVKVRSSESGSKSKCKSEFVKIDSKLQP